MSHPRVVADHDRCVGAGLCAWTAPAVFDQSDDGLVVVREEAPAGADAEAAREAVERCPAGALALR